MKDIINFMYFANNFSQSQLNEMFNVTSHPEHLKNKFKNIVAPNGTDKFFKWFMMLDGGNKESVIDYIQNNYRNSSVS